MHVARNTLALYGWIYGKCWRNAISRGRHWIAQYAVLSALSIYLVMQTMEAVIFRLALLSIPIWAAWAWALHEKRKRRMRARPIAPLELMGARS